MPSTLAPEEENSIILVPGKKGKRVLAELADFFLMLVLEMMVYALVALGIDHSPLGLAASEQIALLNEESQRSGLRIQDEENDIYSDEKLAETYVERVYAYDGTNEPTDSFYRYYCKYESPQKPLYSVERYNAEILELGQEGCIFESSGEGRVAVLSSTLRIFLKDYVEGERANADVVNAARTVKEFYSKKYQVAWAEFAQSTPYSDYLKAYTNAATKHYLMLGLGAIFSYILAGGVFYFLIPCIGKTGRAVGKRVMHLEPLGEEGEPLRWSQIFLRGTVSFLIGSFGIPFATFFVYGLDGFMLPFALFGMTALRLSLFLAFGGIFGMISTGFMIIRQDGASLSEILSHTKVFTNDVALIGAERAKIEAERAKQNEQ